MAGTFQWRGPGGTWQTLSRSFTSRFEDDGAHRPMIPASDWALHLRYDGSIQSGGQTGGYDALDPNGQVLYAIQTDALRLSGGVQVRFDATGFTATVNLSTGPQDDILVGGLAADRLRGGGGADTLTGGEGDDVFAGTLAEFDGDVITDFAAGDVLEIFDGWGQTAVLGDDNILTIGGIDIALDPAADYSALALRHVYNMGFLNLVFGPPSVTISAIDADKAEGDHGQTTTFTFRATRDGPLDGAASVKWTVSGEGQNPVSNAQFVALGGVAAFEPGEASVDIIIEVRGDDEREQHESFVVTLSDPVELELGVDVHGYGWVRNDDSPNQFVAIDPTEMWTSLEGAEGWTGDTREMSVMLTRTGDRTERLEVGWSVGPGTTGASADAQDFEEGQWPSGTAVFEAGSSTAIVIFHVRGDAAYEPNETFTFTIDPDPAKTDFDPDKVSIEGEIYNDDATVTPKVSIRAEAVALTEGDEGDETPFIFVVERTGEDLSQWTSVQWKLTPRGAHPADLDDLVEGEAYEGFLHFAPGQTSKEVTLLLKGDDAPEPDETFSIVITAEGADVEIDRINGTILDDDSPEPEPAPEPEPEPNPTPNPQPEPGLTPEVIESGFGAAAGLRLESLKNAPPTLTLADGSVVANPLYAAAAALTDLMARFEAGLVTRETLMEGVIELARPTSAVALQVYQFFTGAAPSLGGLNWLVDSPDNPNDLTDAYYARFNETNRYLNFAVNLGVEGEGARNFTAAYGELSFVEAARKAYDLIIGFDEARDEGLDVNAALSWLSGQQSYFEAFAGSALGGKAALVGYLMFAGMQEKVGRYFEATHQWLEGAFEGDAQYGQPLVGAASATLPLDLL